MHGAAILDCKLGVSEVPPSFWGETPTSRHVSDDVTDWELCLSPIMMYVVVVLEAEAKIQTLVCNPSLSPFCFRQLPHSFFDSYTYNQ